MTMSHDPEEDNTEARMVCHIIAAVADDLHEQCDGPHTVDLALVTLGIARSIESGVDRNKLYNIVEELLWFDEDEHPRTDKNKLN